MLERRGQRKRDPETVNRRAERRWAQRPFAKGARTPLPRACNGILEAPLGAPPLGLRGEGPPAKAETRRPPWRRPKAAADFAWLFDNVNRMRAQGRAARQRGPLSRLAACGERSTRAA